VASNISQALALGVEPKNPKAFYRRGRAKQALGQDDGARKDLLKALEYSPESDDPAIKKALRELDREEACPDTALPDCSLIVYQCTCTHSPLSPP
jgi:tetratricopeptide (TPR) repeat protein